MKLRRLLTLALLMSSPLLMAKDIKMAIGLSLPPYVISESNSGLELDIVRAALAIKGHTLTPVYVPFARVVTSVQTKQTDAAMTVTESSGLEGVSYSDSHVTYQNMAITLESSGIAITSINDLKGKSIAAFQNAKLYLGPEFKAIADENGKSYSEIANQESQVAMLFIGRAQVVISDINIFKYFKEKTKTADTSKPYKLHEIFKPTNYKVAFNDPAIRDDFNEGLKQLKASGKYQEIFSKYIK